MAVAEYLRESELAILNAPFEERGWALAIESIAKVTRSSGAHLLGLGGPMLVPLNVVVGNYAGYEAYFADPELHGRNNWRVGTVTVPMAVQHEADYAAYRRDHPTSDYDDGVSDLDIPFGCQSAMFLDSNSMVGLALLRSRRDGPCRMETLRDFTLLRYQLSRAIRMQMALDGEAAELMVGDTRSLNNATILLDRHGSVSALTGAAEELLGESGPLRLDGLALRLCDRTEDRHFQNALARLLKSDGRRDALIHQAQVTSRYGCPISSWKLFALRLPPRPHGLGFEPHLAISLRPARTRERRGAELFALS